jgi:hypothetical protein
MHYWRSSIQQKASAEASRPQRDVQALAGHSSLTATQRYIEVNSEAKRRLGGMVTQMITL